MLLAAGCRTGLQVSSTPPRPPEPLPAPSIVPVEFTPVCGDANSSPRATERVEVEIWNGADEALAVGWLDPQGELRDDGWITPLQVWRTNSFRCHAFSVVGPGRERLVVRAEPDAPRYLITAAGEAIHAHRDDALRALVTARDARYDRQEVAGFTVYTHKKLDVPTDTLALFRTRLSDLPRLLGPARVAAVRQVPLFLERTQPRRGGSASYHPWVDEPTDDRSDTPPKEDAVQILDLPDTTRSLRREQPLVLVHEYVHAFHYHASPRVRRAITAQYQAALRSGAYDEVLRHDGSTERAYALNTEDEYFAEISEAYLGTNDWYPFTRGQLLVHDPGGHALAKSVWGEPAYRRPVTAAACDGPVSSPGAERTTLEVANASATPISVQWVQSDGNMHPQGELAPGTSTIITTWAGHVFEVQHAGACAARYVATVRPGRVVVE